MDQIDKNEINAPIRLFFHVKKRYIEVEGELDFSAVTQLYTALACSTNRMEILRSPKSERFMSCAMFKSVLEIMTFHFAHFLDNL